MDNKQQKEITLEDVIKMTLEEFRQLPEEQRAAFTQEQKAEIRAKMERKERIRCLDFINKEKFSEFMTSNGYELVGYDHNRYNFDDRYIHFSDFSGYDKAYRYTNRGLILLGPQSEWDKSMEGFTVKNIVGNPFVKYIEWSLTEFKIYSIVNNPGSEGWGSDEPNYMGKLEKDLSKEWIEFWALEEEDYVKYVLEECEQVQKETPKSIERHKNLLAKRIVELQKETAGYIAGDNEKLEKYNAIEQIVTQAKLEKEVGACVQYGAKQGWKDNDTKDIVGLGSIFGSEK